MQPLNVQVCQKTARISDKCTNAVNNVQPIINSSHMAKILLVYNRLQAGDYENSNGGKRRVSRLTQFIHATLQLQ